MNHGSLFSGIGGFDLAASWMKWENVFHCDINPFARKILSHYWPKAESYADIKETDFTKWRGLVHILTGGFPCQPFSHAGERQGTSDDRNLWPEMLRTIKQISPRWVVGENVRGLTNWNRGVVFDAVQADLESAGYEVAPFLLPAAGVLAPHQRDRIFFVAHAHHAGLEGNEFRKAFDQNEEREQASGSVTQLHQGNYWKSFPVESPVRDGNDGLPTRLDGITIPAWRKQTFMAAGNAVVPQLALHIFKAIQQYEINTRT